MTHRSPILEYFGRLEIIHLHTRTDRYVRLQRSLKELNVSLDDSRVRIPKAVIVDSLNGFSSKQVYGNFLSHLDILKRALADDCSSVLVMEDDAIFRSHLRSEMGQLYLIEQLREVRWDIVYLGHPISAELREFSKGFLLTDSYFKWAHCYAVNKRVLPALVEFLETSSTRPAGHPKGGKLYIDGAITMFRQTRPDLKCYVHNPTLSVQSGSPSGIADAKWYDKLGFLRAPLACIRLIRDEMWRHFGVLGTK